MMLLGRGKGRPRESIMSINCMMGAIGEGVGGDEKIMDQETTWLTLL